jgi:hypothetical protein
MYRNAEKKAVEILGGSAQGLANRGELVLAACFNPKGSGHVAIVCPSEEEYNDELGPLVGESGARCRITHTKYAFEKWGYKPRFFVIPKKGEAK